MTTGNAKPFRENILSWFYFMPEIHISLFTPNALKKLLESEGMAIRRCPLGLTVDIYKYKLLKNLRVKNRSWIFEILPWASIARVLDWRYRLSETIIVGVKADKTA